MKPSSNNKFIDTILGAFPNDWEIVQLRDVAELTDGDWILKKYYTDVGVRLIQVGDVGTGSFEDKSSRFISEKSAQELNCTYVNPNKNVLISRMPTPIGRACIAPSLPYPYITAVDVSIVTPNEEKVDRSFMVFALNSRINLSQCERFATGTTRQRVSRSNLEKVYLPLPPLHEQRAIAHVLSTVREAIEATEKVIAVARELKRSLMKKLLIDELEDIPTLPLEQAVNILTGGTPSTRVREYWDGNIDWVTAKDVSVTQGPFITKTERCIAEAGINNSPAKILPELTTILIARGATMGNVRIIERPMAMNQTCYGLSVKEGYDPLFLYYTLSLLKDEMLSISYGTIFTTVTRGVLSQLPLRFPSLGSQEFISKTLLAVDNKIMVELRQKSVLEALFSSLLHHLMTGKVRVQSLPIPKSLP